MVILVGRQKHSQASQHTAETTFIRHGQRLGHELEDTERRQCPMMKFPTLAMNAGALFSLESTSDYLHLPPQSRPIMPLVFVAVQEPQYGVTCTFDEFEPYVVFLGLGEYHSQGDT